MCGRALGMPKRILEGSTQSERAANRRRLGTLRQLTVQPATRRRYDKAVDRFLDFLKKENLTLPSSKAKLDPILCDYLEELWSTGEGRGLACDTLAGLQDLQPGLRNNLPAAWRLLRTWQTNELPSRAPPLAEHIVHAMCGWAIFNGWHSFAMSLLIGFYAMLRTGEILGLLSPHIECGPTSLQALISLGLTKGGKRHGAAESESPSTVERTGQTRDSFDTLATSLALTFQPVFRSLRHPRVGVQALLAPQGRGYVLVSEAPELR